MNLRGRGGGSGRVAIIMASCRWAWHGLAPPPTPPLPIIRWRAGRRRRRGWGPARGPYLSRRISGGMRIIWRLCGYLGGFKPRPRGWGRKGTHGAGLGGGAVSVSSVERPNVRVCLGPAGPRLAWLADCPGQQHHFGMLSTLLARTKASRGGGKLPVERPCSRAPAAGSPRLSHRLNREKEKSLNSGATR
jgi:hypothetical protein